MEPEEKDLDQVGRLILAPIRTLLRYVPGIVTHADPYTGPFEPYHHLITHEQTWDLDAIGTVVKAHGGPVLDLGCGSGRLALRLARAGHDVTAVDRSAPALARLRDILVSEPETAARIHILEGDFTAPELLPAQRFHSIAIGDLSVNIFTTANAIRGLFGAAERAMTENGLLCFPVLNTEGVDQVMRQVGMAAVPFTGNSGTQRLLWYVLRHEREGPFFYRTLFIQEDNASDGTIRGHATAVRERLWTAETLLPHLTATRLCVVGTEPLKMPPTAGPSVGATLLTIQRQTFINP